MKHYIKLYFTCIKRSLMSRLEYKQSLLIAIIAFLISNVASILSIYFVVNAIPELKVADQGVWNIWQIGFLYGFTMLPVAIDHFFSDELWLVSYRRVKDGSLDPHFLRPAPTLFMVIAETFQPEGLGELIVGITMLLVCGLNPSVQVLISGGNVFLFIVSILFGAMIITSFKIMIAGLAFVMKSSGPVLQVIYNAISYLKYPRGIYPFAIKIILTFILPFAIFISFPVEIFLGYSSINPWILSSIIIGVAIGLFALSILVWSLCAKKYESTGS